MQGLHKLLLLYVLTCLGQNGHGITGGKIVPESMMQYMVSLQDGRGNHLCAGFLVSKNVLITSASCNKSELEVVYYGCHNLEDKRKHHRIDKRCIDSGIMLLKLRKDVTGDNVKTIEIPNSEIDLKVNRQCVVAGWGPENCEKGLVKKLRKVDVSVLNPLVCNKYVTDPPANVIYAGGYMKGFCEVDAGGPLVCGGKAVAVVSFNKKHYHNVYTDISTKHKWIRDKMNNPSGKDCTVGYGIWHPF